MADSITLEQSGPTLLDFVRGLERRLERGVKRSVDDLGKEWTKIVVDSTWLSPRPSPYSKIRADERGEGVLEFGWTDYRGGKANSTRRINERLPIFAERQPAIVERALSEEFED